MQPGHSERHDPRVMTGGVKDGIPTKRRKIYKYTTRDEALAGHKKKRKTEFKRKGATVQECMSWLPMEKDNAMRGGGKKKKRWVHQEWGKSLRCIK